MTTYDLQLMLAEKENPCLSIIVPTHRYTRDRMKNPELIEKAIHKAKNLLNHSAWPIETIKSLESKLESILAKMDYLRLQEGLAIFLSPNIFKIELLPFIVKEKVMLGKTFEIRDLVYFNQFLKPYYLLAVSKKRVRLLKGSGKDLQEITNSDFPKQYVEEYEYAHASIGSSSRTWLKAFERDKSILNEIRIKSFFKQTDNSLDKYLKEDTLFFIAGVEEEIANFEAVSQHLKKIAGKIQGNFDHDAVYPLAESVWKKIQETVKESNQQFINKLNEDIGRRMATEGMQDVWKAATEGKGLTLLVEKDYEAMAYQKPQEDPSKIHLTPPSEKYEVIRDAADDVIEIVLEKGGNAVIVENGELEKFRHIALLLRY